MKRHTRTYWQRYIVMGMLGVGLFAQTLISLSTPTVVSADEVNPTPTPTATATPPSIECQNELCT